MGVGDGVRAGRAYVELGLDEKYKAQLRTAKTELDGWGKAVNAASRARDGGLAMKAKAFFAEERASGDVALERLIRQGPTGLLNVLGGGIAVAVITTLASGIANATEKANELSEAFKKGDMNAADMANEIGLSLPLLGEVFRAGNALNELFTGQKSAIKLVNDEAKLTATILDAQTRSAKALKAVLDGIKTSRDNSETRSANIGADAFTQERNNLLNAQRERKRSAGGKLKTDLESVTKPIDDELTAQKEKVRLAREAKEKGDRGEFSESDYGKSIPEGHKDLITSLKNASDMLVAIQKKRSDAVAQVRSGHTDDQKAAHDDEMASVADIAKRQNELFGKGVADAVRNASEEVANARTLGLREEGKLLDADLLQIKTSAAAKVQGILKAAEDQKKAIGATGFLDPRGMVIDAMAQGQIAGVNSGAAAKTKSAQQAEYERTRGQQQALDELKAAGVVGHEERERAAIDARYAYELDVATQAGRPLADIKARQAQEIANMEARFAERRRQVNKDADQEIAGLNIQLTTRGLAQRLAMNELERRNALEAEMDPLRRTGVDPAKLNTIFDKRRVLELSHGMDSFGTFSAAAAQVATRGGIGGGQLMQELVTEVKGQGKTLKAIATNTATGATYGA